MLCPYKNSYLQLETSVNPRLVNKAVRRAMRKTQFDPHDELPAAQRMKSMQPSLYGPCTDITRARMGFERLGLRIIIKDINSHDSFIKLQAIHSLLDQVQISENALFLVSLNVVYKLIDLLSDRDPIVREKVCLILTHLGNYYQGRIRIIARPVAIDRLMFLFMRDRKEIRYAAARCLSNLTRYSCESIIKNDKVVENLLKVVKNEHAGIILLHLESLRNLSEWDPTKPLKANAFQVMLKLISNREDVKVSQMAMDCMSQLCKHSVGQKLADKYDLTRFLLRYIDSDNLQVIISAVGLIAYSSVSTRAKWRSKEFVYDLGKRMVGLCLEYDAPVLQLRAMQVLINICDCADIRYYIKTRFEKKIQSIKIRIPEQWDGTTETKDYGVEFGHNYRTRYIEKAETIKNDRGDHMDAVTVAGYLQQVQHTKDRLIKILNFKPFRD